MSHRRSTSTLIASCALLVAVQYVRGQKPPIGRADSAFQRGIRALPGRSLSIDLATGGVLGIHGWPRDSVHLEAHLAGRDWADTKVHLDRIPTGTRLRTGLGGSPFEKSTSHEFEMWVPSNTDIEIHSAGGAIHIANVNGEFRGETRGGSIVLEQVRGFADLSTQGGHILISDSELGGRVTTGGGAIRVERVSGGVYASVENGSVKDKIRRPR